MNRRRWIAALLLFIPFSLYAEEKVGDVFFEARKAYVVAETGPVEIAYPIKNKELRELFETGLQRYYEGNATNEEKLFEALLFIASQQTQRRQPIQRLLAGAEPLLIHAEGSLISREIQISLRERVVEAIRVDFEKSGVRDYQTKGGAGLLGIVFRVSEDLEAKTSVAAILRSFPSAEAMAGLRLESLVGDEPGATLETLFWQFDHLLLATWALGGLQNEGVEAYFTQGSPGRLGGKTLTALTHFVVGQRRVGALRFPMERILTAYLLRRFHSTPVDLENQWFVPDFANMEEAVSQKATIHYLRLLASLKTEGVKETLLAGLTYDDIRVQKGSLRGMILSPHAETAEGIPISEYIFAFLSQTTEPDLFKAALVEAIAGENSSTLQTRAECVVRALVLSEQMIPNQKRNLFWVFFKEARRKQRWEVVRYFNEIPTKEVVSILGRSSGFPFFLEIVFHQQTEMDEETAKAVSSVVLSVADERASLTPNRELALKAILGMVRRGWMDSENGERVLASIIDDAPTQTGKGPDDMELSEFDQLVKTGREVNDRLMAIKATTTNAAKGTIAIKAKEVIGKVRKGAIKK